MNVGRRHILVLTLFIIVLSTLVRFYPLMEYSSEPTTYSGGGAYSQKGIIRSGHLITQSEAKSLIGDHVFAAGIGEYATYPFFPTYVASMQIVADLEPFTWESRLALSLSFTLPVLSVTLCMFRRLLVGRRRQDETANTTVFLGMGVILLYSQLASPFLVNQLGSQGWIFFLFPTYLLFFREDANPKVEAISILFLCLLPAVYFTSASFLLLWLSIATLYRLATKRKIKNLARITVLFAVAYLAYNVIIAISRSMTIVHVFTNLYDQIIIGFSGFSSSSLSLPSEYLVSTSIANKAKYLINGVLVGSPILLYLAHRRKMPFFRSRRDDIAIAGIISLPLLAVLLFLWLGSLSIGRIPEYGSVMSLVVMSILLGTSRERLRKVLIILAVSAVISSTITYVTDENTPYRYLTHSESQAAEWMMSVSETNQSLFTDNRLAGVFIGNGFLDSTGIVEKESVNYTLSRIISVYYGDSGEAAYKVVRNEYLCTYVFFSKGMTMEAPAIFLYNYPIRPAPEDFLVKYEDSSYFDKICDNGEGIIFAVR